MESLPGTPSVNGVLKLLAFTKSVTTLNVSSMLHGYPMRALAFKQLTKSISA